MLVHLGNDILEELTPFETYRVLHHLVHEAEGTVGEEGHLIPMGHQAAQDGRFPPLSGGTSPCLAGSTGI